MRTAVVQRNTKETQIQLALTLDGKGASAIATGVGFLDHMLTLFAAHGRFDLNVTVTGDTHVDFHHTVEDTGIALGEAFRQALGEKRGICRYGDINLPMDEALVLCAVDLSGRDCLGYALNIPTAKVGDFDTELTEEFFLGFTRACGCALHLHQFAGTNSHHIIECAFKAFGRAMKQACSIDPTLADEIPSTKGVLA